MALVLKSDKSAKLRKLSDTIEGAVLSLDFRNGEYLKGSQELSLTDVIETSNNKIGGYYDNIGAYKETGGAQTPRVSLAPSYFYKGLVTEGPLTNQFHNPSAPATHTKGISMNVSNAYKLRIVGEGSISLSLDGVPKGVATEGKDVVVQVTTTKDYLAKFEVVGKVEYAEFVESLHLKPTITRAVTSSALSHDLNKIKRSLVPELLPQMSGCLVLKVIFEKDVGDRGGLANRSVGIAQVKTTSASLLQGFTVAYTDGGTDGNVMLRSYDSKEKKTMVDDAPVNAAGDTYALNFSKTHAKLYKNGEFIAEHSVDSVDILDIYIGGSQLWSINTLSFVEQVAIYSRELSDDELRVISSK